jgi:Na+/melibiose symporter-like transporter
MEQEVHRMTRNPQERRSPEQIRAGNKRLGLILLAIVAVFFMAAVVNQYLLSRG